MDRLVFRLLRRRLVDHADPGDRVGRRTVTRRLAIPVLTLLIRVLLRLAIPVLTLLICVLILAITVLTLLIWVLLLAVPVLTLLILPLRVRNARSNEDNEDANVDGEPQRAASTSSSMPAGYLASVLRFAFGARLRIHHRLPCRWSGTSTPFDSARGCRALAVTSCVPSGQSSPG